MSSKQVFKLFSQCIPTKGARRSAISDLQRNNYELIPNSLYNILTEQSDKSLEEIKKSFNNEFDKTIDGYFSFLLENEFGFWTSTPELFPKMDLSWEEVADISNAIIDISKNSTHDFESIFNQLQELGCAHIQLRIYDTYNFDELSNVLELLDDSIVTSIEIFIKYDEMITEEQCILFVSRFPRIERLYIHSSPENKFFTKDKSKRLLWDVFYLKQQIDSHHHCGIINTQYFAPNIYSYTESLQYNSCLNKKISIDTEGNIKNCPSMNASYGSITDTTLKEVVQNNAFTKVWSTTKEKITVCRDCEFRHICTDCRAHLDSDKSIQQPKKCDYNPYLAKWKEEEGYLPIEEMTEEEITNTKLEYI